MLKSKTKKLIVFLFIFILILSAGCDDDFRVIPDGDWEMHESKYFNYYIQPGVEIDLEEIISNLEILDEFWEEYANLWGYPVEKVDYYRFISREEVGRLTGVPMNGRAIADEAVVHSINDTDSHEVSHIFTMRSIAERDIKVGNFWLEGIAMYYTWPHLYSAEKELYEEKLGAYGGSSVHYQAQELLKEENLPELELMIYGNKVFNKYREEISYSAAGSFITYLLGSAHSRPEEIENFRIFLGDINGAGSSDEIKASFFEYFGNQLSDIENEWHIFLEDWSEEKLK